MVSFLAGNESEDEEEEEEEEDRILLRAGGKLSLDVARIKRSEAAEGREEVSEVEKISIC